MNLNTLIAVSAYAGDAHQVAQNMPLYLHHGCPVLILTPEDAPIVSLNVPGNVNGLSFRSAGKKGWIGAHTLERHRLFLEILLQQRQQYFLFNDSDSFCLSPQLPRYLYDDPNVIWSNEVVDTNPAPSMLPKLALQPPYFLSRETIQGMLNTVNKLPTSYYGEPASPDGWPLPFPTECIDHYFLQLAHGSGFQHKSFPTGASFETQSPVGMEEMSNLVRNHGRVMIHSVKTDQMVKRLTMDRSLYVKRHAR